ncbi:hypothetical protein E3V36_07590 [Candidatus Marinimicrobia bacterium MT.SAG.2]|nr:hypothetical protein E3V36_07590 [Candidatus Marinimicrobia bacterium MT.SAG.2]
MRRSGKVEHLQIVTSTDNSTPGNLSMPPSNILDLLIQNVKTNACYVTVNEGSNPTADDKGIYLASGDSVSLEDMRFDYFAVINVTNGQNVTVNVTAFGA